MLADIIIDTPLCSLSTLGITDPIYTTERFLPKLLVDLKIFSSITQVRKNRPDLNQTLTHPDCLDIKIGKHRLYIIVGQKGEP